MKKLGNVRAKHRGGYIAIVTAVIVTAIVLAIALVFSSSNLLSRFDSARIERKHVTLEVAKGCLEYARLKLSEGPYSGDEIVPIGEYSCRILPIEMVGETVIITATSTILTETTNLKLTVHKTTVQPISLQEISDL